MMVLLGVPEARTPTVASATMRALRCRAARSPASNSGRAIRWAPRASTSIGSETQTSVTPSISGWTTPTDRITLLPCTIAWQMCAIALPMP